MHYPWKQFDWMFCAGRSAPVLLCSPKWLMWVSLQSILYFVPPPPGTYGTVFKAKDRESGEIVALKVVRLDEDDEVRLCYY